MNALLSRTNVPIVLTVAGFDPSGGAGISSDIKTLSALDVWGMAVPTTLTNQSNKNFNGITPVDENYFKNTLENIFSSYKVSALKIGLITEKYQVETIVECIKKYAPKIVVLDPVITSSTGFKFWDDELMTAITGKLLPCVDVITPNYKEAVTILDASGFIGLDNINKREVAKGLQRKFRCKVAMTGGDVHSGDTVEDVFFDGLELKHRVANYIDIPSYMKHGTGCTFSSSLTAYLAKGEDFISSCFNAAIFVEMALNNIMMFDKSDGGIDQLAKYRTRRVSL